MSFSIYIYIFISIYTYIYIYICIYIYIHIYHICISHLRTSTMMHLQFRWKRMEPSDLCEAARKLLTSKKEWYVHQQTCWVVDQQSNEVGITLTSSNHRYGQHVCYAPKSFGIAPNPHFWGPMVTLTVLCGSGWTDVVDDLQWIYCP